jgi:hypothetical protein
MAPHNFIRVNLDKKKEKELNLLLGSNMTSLSGSSTKSSKISLEKSRIFLTKSLIILSTIKKVLHRSQQIIMIWDKKTRQIVEIVDIENTEIK